MQLLPLAILQSVLLAGGQVFLKLALGRMEPFGWSWNFWGGLLTNWQFALCGLLYGAGTVLWFLSSSASRSAWLIRWSR